MSKNEDLIQFHDLAKNANGGSEQMARRLYERIPRELLEQTQITISRQAAELDPTKTRLTYQADLPGDPNLSYLANGGWKNFHKHIFVSNEQMNNFIRYYNIPYSRCIVIQNGIVPIEAHQKPDDKIRLLYTSTPHRGLGILAAVFDKLSKDRDDLELEVFSSFSLYGWDKRDEDYKEIFDFLKNHPKVVYHGAKPNEEVRDAIKRSHIFAYPSVWPETSCLCLMEAMSGGLLCVHPNFGALYETAANLTNMYQWHEDQAKHAGIFHVMLQNVIDTVKTERVQTSLAIQKSYADNFYNIEEKAKQWEMLIRSLLNAPREIEQNVQSFNTLTGQFS